MTITIQKVPPSILDARTKYGVYLNAAKSLRVGEGFVWHGHPKNYGGIVRSWNSPHGILKARKRDGELWIVCLPRD